MSGGGGSTDEIGGGLLTAGLIASTVMSDGATAPLLGEELAGGAVATGGMDAAATAAMGGAGGAFAPAAGMGADLFSTGAASALPSGIDTLGQYSAQNLGEYGGPQIGSDAATASNTVVPQVSTAQYGPPASLENAGVGSSQLAGPPTSLANPGVNTSGATPNIPWYTSAYNALTNNPQSALYNKNGMNLAQKGLLGGAGIATLLAMKNSGALTPKGLPQYNPVTAQSMGLNAQMSPSYMPNRASQWGYAQGGSAVTSYTPQDVIPADLQNQQSATPAQLQQLMAQYGVTPQQATQGIQSLMGNQTAPKAGYSEGGETHLKEGSFIVPADVVSHFGNGSTDAGLHALSRHLGAIPIRGSGDGMSDDIHTTIDGRQPARVADGEAMVSPERVKALGNGSTDAGAKKLYGMMDKIRKARTGSTKQGKQIKADKYLPT